VNRAQFAAQSREDVVQATAIGIAWAEKELGVKAPRVLWGHREGAAGTGERQFAITPNYSSMAPWNCSLTSPAMNFRELLDFQIPDPKQRNIFLEAIKRKDDSFLLKQ
jgi:hypothetical protein